MCGIAGFIDFNCRFGIDTLQSMTDTMTHRGPDGSGYEVWNNDNFSIGFGHRRLSIIDLSEHGKQPMSKAGWHITYNGEVYNYLEIREKLQNLGHQFSSGSDTEVILSAFQEWGIEAVKQFNGMFAFAIYNEQAKKIYLVRDRVGVKPMYIYQKNDCLLFASELKAFHTISDIKLEVNPQAVQLYFTHGTIPSPNCIFKHCSKLPQASYLEIDLEHKSQNKQEYWNVFHYVSDDPIDATPQEILQHTEKLLTSACNFRMIADVPVGIFLSGGYDSSLVTALLQKDRTEKLKTFTIGFERATFDESKYAEQVASHLGTEHHSHICTEAEAKEIIPLLPYHYDEPLGDNSAIPTYLVSKLSRQQVTVALSADGGDEQFVGYTRFLKAVRIARFKQGLPRFSQKILARLLEKSNNDIYYKIGSIFKSPTISNIPTIQTALLTVPELKQLLRQYHVLDEVTLPANEAKLNSIFATEYTGYLQDTIMTKVDRVGMAVSLEGREPLLDYRLAEWTMHLPLDIKYKDDTLKYLLKKITHKYIPKTIMERPKQGFGVPINQWLRTDLKFLLEDLLAEQKIKQQSLFDYHYIARRKRAFLEGHDNTSFIWHLLVFQMWYERWVA